MPVIDPTAPAQVVAPTEGPCTWPLDLSCAPDWNTYPPAVQSAATTWATYILWALTGRRYGPCSVTIRPCGPTCGNVAGYMTWPVSMDGTRDAGAPWMTPWIDAGVWRNCGCQGSCSCAARCEVGVPGPVAVIDEVLVDGIVLDPSAYRLDYVRGQAVLVRTDGECWPECQDMNVDVDQPGSFAITYQRGVAVPRAGQIAAGELAAEFAKACSGAECALPQQMASLSRNGVDIEMVDPATIAEEGLTGIKNVDLWIRSVNPARRAQRSRVASVDTYRGRFS